MLVLALASVPAIITVLIGFLINYGHFADMAAASRSGFASGMVVVFRNPPVQLISRPTTEHNHYDRQSG